MSKITIVSGCDANYFPILMELIHSIRSFEQSKDIDISIIDSGLTAEQNEILKTKVENINAPDWPCDLPASKTKGKDYLKSCVCRPFIPKLFPGYDIYIWLDADIWLQTWDAIDLYIKGAQKGAFTVCPQADRAYGKAMRLKWLGPFPFKARSFYYSNARKPFGGKIARELFKYPTLNVGAFSLAGDAPHWDRWQKLIVEAMQKGRLFTAEQLTIGMMIYLEDYKVEKLPAYCNWLCTAKMVWDEERELFVEPYLPHEPVSVMHISGLDDIRLNRSIQSEVKTLAGGTITRSLRYPAFDGEEAA